MLATLLLIGLIIWAFSSVFKKQSPEGAEADELRQTVNEKLTRRDRSWFLFLKKQHDQAKSASEKRVIENIFNNLIESGLQVPLAMAPAQITPKQSKQDEFAVKTATLAKETTIASQEMELDDESIPRQTSKVAQSSAAQLDNATLLLYFGAFLFVASAGLFVAFAGMDGSIRTLLVLAVSITMYLSGIYLYKNKQKFSQAGLAFSGMGLSTAPLVGLATYSYVYDSTNGALVWFVTSIFCLGLYLHALFALRKPLLNYVFIFTLVSLFESFVSIVDAPVYIFGWIFSLIGILLLLLNGFFKLWDDFSESAKLTSQVFVPLSLLLSVLLLSNHGEMQLGISLGLAALFYGLQASQSASKLELENYTLAAHVLGLSSFATILYAATSNWTTTGILLTVLAVLQTTALLAWNSSSVLTHNYSSVILFSLLFSLASTIKDAKALFLVAVATSLVTCFIWIRQRRTELYSVFILTLVGVSIIWGQLVSEPAVSPAVQAAVLFLPMALQMVVLRRKKLLNTQKNLTEIAIHTYAVSVAMLSAYTLVVPTSLMVLYCFILLLCTVVVTEAHKQRRMAELSGLIMFLPLLRTFALDNGQEFLNVTLIALVANILLAIRYRTETNRWCVTGLWLLLPFALAHAHAGGKWDLSLYAWSYLTISLGLILSRAIARGVIFRSQKVSLASMEKTASQSYAAGYIVSLTFATVLAFSSDMGIISGSAICVMVFILWGLLTKYIERDEKIAVVLPLLAQIILWSLSRNNLDQNGVALSLALSSVLSVAWYFSRHLLPMKEGTAESLRIGALFAACISPLSYLFYEATLWPMPVGFGVLSALLFAYYRRTSQSARELTLGFSVLSLWWLFAFLQITEVQVYAHSLVALFAGYAYWRSIRSEQKQSQEYITAALCAATIPLVLQALNQANGSFYGWWLLIEQVFIMLLGMTLQNKRMVRWGLYVALGSVLYQLRDLGWAALSVLALFVIGSAVYKIQKYGDK